MSDKIFKYKVIVEAVDKPLKSMQEQLKSINDIFKKQTDQIKKTTEAVNSLANTYKKFEVGKLAVKGLSMGLSSVVDIAGKGMDVLKDFGGMTLDAMQFRERSVYSLGKAFGDGKGKLQELIDLANSSSMDTKQVVGMGNALSTSFKEWEDVKKIIILGGDVMHQFPQLGEQYISAMQKAGAGAMVEEGSDLVKAMKGSYIGYKREIAKELGMKGKDLDNITKVSDLISTAKKNGKLTAGALTRALVESLKGGLKIDLIGGNTIKAAQNSLIGAVSNFQSALESLLISIHWEDYAGTGELAKFLNNITTSLNTQEVRDAIGNAFNNIFAPLKDINESGAIQKFFTTTLPPLIDTVGANMKDAFGWFTDLITGKVSIGSSLKAVFMKVVNTLKDILIYIGELIGAGIKAAMLGNTVGTENIDAEAVREENKKRQEEWVAEKKKEVEDRFDKVLNNSYGETNFTLNFDISNVKKEDAEHVANTVAEKVKAATEADKRAAKNLRMSGGKS